MLCFEIEKAIDRLNLTILEFKAGYQAHTRAKGFRLNLTILEFKDNF